MLKATFGWGYEGKNAVTLTDESGTLSDKELSALQDKMLKKMYVYADKDVVSESPFLYKYKTNHDELSGFLKHLCNEGIEISGNDIPQLLESLEKRLKKYKPDLAVRETGIPAGVKYTLGAGAIAAVMTMCSGDEPDVTSTEKVGTGTSHVQQVDTLAVNKVAGKNYV